MIDEYKIFILNLTNKARQQNLTDVEAGILRSEGQVGEQKAENEFVKGLIRMALDELGVPQPDYPAPVANAVEFLNEALLGKSLKITE